MTSYIQTTIHSKVAKYANPHTDRKRPALTDWATSSEAE